MWFIKGGILLSLAWITYQDIKERHVFVFLFPLITVLLGFLHYTEVSKSNFVYAIGINFIMIAIIFLCSFLYAKLKMKVSFFKEAFGLGDLLFFVAFAIAFPTITFVIMFVFSLLFSLIMGIITKQKSKDQTIPLAGYMSLFLFLILTINWVSNGINLYLI